MLETVSAFVVEVPVGSADVASERLWQLGVRAIEERASNDVAGATRSDVVELWTSVGDDPEALARAASSLDDGWRWWVVEVPAAPAETWREHVAPTWASPTLLLLPAWLDHDPDDRDDRDHDPCDDGAADRFVTVRIEPMGSFGLGDHPTTWLGAAALEEAMSRRPGGEPTRVLDVGCGSGVLSVAAALLGAASVRAIDISTVAVGATRANASSNGVAHLISVDDTPVGHVEGVHDVVVANILAPVLVAAADDLRRLTSPDGVLVISGVLTDAHDHVVDALDPMSVVDTRSAGGWSAVTLRH